MRKIIRRELSGLAANLTNGFRLLFFRPRATKFRYSLHQVVLLLSVGVLVSLVVDYLRYLPRPDFNRYAISGEALSVAGVLLVAYLVTASTRDASKGLRFLVQGLSVGPFIYVIGVLMQQIPLAGAAAWAVYGFVLVWFLAIVGFILHTLSGRRVGRTAAYLASYVAVVIVPPFYIWSGDFWYAPEAEPKTPAYAKINQEHLYYAQPRLVRAATRTLVRGRRGVTDLYFVGFGGYGSQDVFMKEVRFAQDVFDKNFDTRNRSVALINNPATINDVPLATASNLRVVLKRVGEKMNRDEDVLFLFMTSHGSKKNLSVSLPSLWLNDITPAELKAALDEARIKWRVLMISACYSGSFIEPLKDDYTLIATAAAPDKQSFGCGNESEFTYFGKAVLDEQLKTERYLPVAFAKAAESITTREAAEGKDRSDPRLVVGTAIEPKLRELEKRLGRRKQTLPAPPQEAKSTVELEGRHLTTDSTKYSH